MAENADPTVLFTKALSLVLSLKGNSENIRYLTTAFEKALKDVKLTKEEYQKKFDKVVNYLSVINAFIEAKLKLEFDVKELAEVGSTADQQYTEMAKKNLPQYQTAIKNAGTNMLKPALEGLQIVEPVKSADFDEISLCLAVPKYQNGIAHVIKLPGLSKILAEILK